MGIFRLPGQMYQHVYGEYGWFGVAFCVLSMLVLAVGVMTWFDRRR